MRLITVCLLELAVQLNLSAKNSRVSHADDIGYGYVGMARLEDLEPSFRQKMTELNKSLNKAGLEIKFGNWPLNRNPKRQYLMYWSWQIAMEGYRKRTHPTPPVFPGCDIDWFWSDKDDDYITQSADFLGVPNYVAAAMEMVNRFNLRRNPGLTTKVSEGKAAEFLVVEVGCEANGLFPSPKTVTGKDGKSYTLTHAGNAWFIGKEQYALSALCASYGVFLVREFCDIGADTANYYSDDGKWQ